MPANAEDSCSSAGPARYVMIGGFLGAGKTTLINRIGRLLADRGLRVGLITNDQGAGLVDSLLGRSASFPVEEIAGGCFCCRFGSLVEAARRLSEANRPEVFLAEPVGSCTDLVATVSLPLQKIYGDRFRVSPLSVLVDPVRAARILDLEPGPRFSESVLYIYGKQLEEAEFILVNKVDLLDDVGRRALREALEARFPQAAVREVSARTGEGVEAWLDEVLASELDTPRFLDIDYDRYGRGEALLGWLNATVDLRAPEGEEFDGNALLEGLAAGLRDGLREAGIEVAHLKMTLSPAGDPGELAAVNLVRTEATPEFSHRLVEPVEAAELLLNMRAEADPDVLENLTRILLGKTAADRAGRSLEVAIVAAEHFRPGQPEPTHRFTTA